MADHPYFSERVESWRSNPRPGTLEGLVEVVRQNTPCGLRIDEDLLRVSLEACVYETWPRAWWRVALLRLGRWALRRAVSRG